MLSSWEYSPSAVTTIESLIWCVVGPGWPLMGVGVGGVTGSDQAVLGRWNRSTEAVVVAIYPSDGLVGLGQTARCELHCLCFLRKPFVWAGYRGFFTSRWSSYCYLFPFKNVSFCIHQKWCVYVKLLPIHYFALICPFYVFIYFFNENDVWI
jgi:hypothetical protein